MSSICRKINSVMVALCIFEKQSNRKTGHRQHWREYKFRKKKKMNAALPYPALGSNPSSATVRLKTLDGPPGLLSLIPIRFSGEQAVAFTGKLQNLFCMTMYIVNHLIRLLLF